MHLVHLKGRHFSLTLDATVIDSNVKSCIISLSHKYYINMYFPLLFIVLRFARIVRLAPQALSKTFHVSHYVEFSLAQFHVHIVQLYSLLPFSSISC